MIRSRLIYRRNGIRSTTEVERKRLAPLIEWIWGGGGKLGHGETVEARGEFSQDTKVPVHIERPQKKRQCKGDSHILYGRTERM